MADIEAEERDAKELVRILKEWGQDVAFVRRGDPLKDEPDALITFQGEERGVELTVLLDSPAHESGMADGLLRQLRQRIEEEIGPLWRGMIIISLTESLSSKTYMITLSEQLLAALRPELGAQKQIAIDVAGARLRGEPYEHFTEARIGFQELYSTPTPQASEGGLIQAFEKKETRKKPYSTKVNWLLVVDRSGFPHDLGIDKDKVAAEAKRLLAARFERVFLLGKWTSRAPLQVIL